MIGPSAPLTAETAPSLLPSRYTAMIPHDDMLTHIVYYDELIEDPIEQFRDIARFLGIHEDLVDEAAKVRCEPQ
jgi:hypothetical protein